MRRRENQNKPVHDLLVTVDTHVTGLYKTSPGAVLLYKQAHSETQPGIKRKHNITATSALVYKGVQIKAA